MPDGGHIDDEDAPLLGQVVAERYFVENRLGEGGMGTVYTARHVTLDKRVALKVLHGEFSRKPDLVERFLLEAKAASSIRNQHVIDITDFGVTPEGFVFFAMEYLEGKDLHGLLGEWTAKGDLLPWERSKNIFLQVCEALSAAHAKGIIHRDLKPENIFLVDGTGRADYVKLLDFGIAKVEGHSGPDGERRLTKTGMLFGTPEYMAPEQARGQDPDHRVDVYAMGCLLFQLLSGTVPFQADSFMAILTQHMVEPVPALGLDLLVRSGAPNGLVAVVNKALAKDREERFATMDEFAQAVREAVESTASDTPTPEPNPGESMSSRTRKPRWTGSVRGIDVLVEKEAEADAELALTEAKSQGKSKILAAVAAAVLLGGCALAAVMLMGGSEENKNPGPVTPAAALEPAAATVLPLAEPDALGLQPSGAATDGADQGQHPANSMEADAGAEVMAADKAATKGHESSGNGTTVKEPSEKHSADSSGEDTPSIGKDPIQNPKPKVEKDLTIEKDPKAEKNPKPGKIDDSTGLEEPVPKNPFE